MLNKKGSRRFNKAQECSIMLQKVQEGSRGIKSVLEGSQMLKNVKEERIPKILRVIIDSCFGWVENQEGYCILALFTD